MFGVDLDTAIFVLMNQLKYVEDYRIKNVPVSEVLEQMLDGALDARRCSRSARG